jgi:hypothetical protein
VELVEKNMKKLNGNLNPSQMNQLIFICLLNREHLHILQINKLLSNMLNSLLLKPRSLFFLNQLLYSVPDNLSPISLQSFDDQLLQHLKNQLFEVYKLLKVKQVSRERKVAMEQAEKVY